MAILQPNSASAIAAALQQHGVAQVPWGLTQLPSQLPERSAGAPDEDSCFPHGTATGPKKASYEGAGGGECCSGHGYLHSVSL
jgi:hypothetical protein